jgi:O-antigen/teichoic acid export membrane protein
MLPAFVEKAGDRRSLQQAMRKALAGGSYLTIPVALLAAVIAKPLVVLVLTEKWLPVVVIFQMTCISASLALPQLVNLRAYMALGNSRLYLRLQILKVLIGTLVISATAVLTKDIYWVAATTSFCSFLFVLAIDMPPSGRITGFGWAAQIRLLIPIFFVAGLGTVLSLPVQLFEIPYIFQIALQCCIFGFVYIGGSIIMKIPGFEEARRIFRNLH